MTKEYGDIIHLPHHVSETRPGMALINRAAQFAPFAALTGYDAAIKETGRLTDERVELDEYMKDDLNNRLQIIGDRLKEQPEISITCFQPDSKKEGGSYVTVKGRVKKINVFERMVLMIDGTVIHIDDILSLEGKIFE